MSDETPLDEALKDLAKKAAPRANAAFAQHADRGGSNFNNTGVILVQAPGGPRRNPWRRRVLHARWRAKQVVIALAIGIGICFVALAVFSLKPYFDAGYSVPDLFVPGRISGLSLFETGSRALLFGIPAGIALFLAMLGFTWGEDAPAA